MKILVIGGIHGNEPLGIEVVKKLRDKESPVDSTFGNEMAIKAEKRFIKQDLNRVFPGDINSKYYEIKRAGQIRQLCTDYDVVIDFHNTHCSGNDCAFIGKTAESQLLSVASFLNLDKVVIADYDCLNKFATNCISVEVSLNSVRMDVDFWVDIITKLSKQKVLSCDTSDVAIYNFEYRISLEDRDRLSLKEKDFQAFKPVSRQLATKLGIKSPAYPIFIADKYTPYNFGGLLTKKSMYNKERI